ncbi:DUF3592 domain-containing protein [Streptomyces pratensis]|uniref:DUF3592 domain-containing protein n=1 Tax=Streptomyces pratensis TaxID=1169025 RepID=UPI003018F1D6
MDIVKRVGALVAALVLLLLGGLVLVIAGGLATKAGGDGWTAPDRPADAVVTGHVQTRSGGGPAGARWAPRVTYEAEGRRYTARLRGSEAGRGLRVGAPVEVVYRADRPGRPYTRQYAEQGAPGVATDIVVIVSAVVMAVALLTFGWLLLTVARGTRTTVLDL